MFVLKISGIQKNLYVTLILQGNFASFVHYALQI
jgi:hypothetical protein